MELPEHLISDQIKRGAIFFSNIFEEIGHPKYFIVVGVAENTIVGFFFINSDIHPSIKNKPELLNMQCPLKRSDYPFLKYDSFLCATNIITRSKDNLIKSIRTGNTTYVGDLKEDLMESILHYARESRLFKPIEKKQFFY